MQLVRYPLNHNGYGVHTVLRINKTLRCSKKTTVKNSCAVTERAVGPISPVTSQMCIRDRGGAAKNLTYSDSYEV